MQILSDYKRLLKQYISYKTISTTGSENEINKAVDWLQDLFTQNSFSVEIVKGYDNPVVIAKKELNKNFPTVLIYGHYDVQPASREEWGTDPFLLQEKADKLIARGAADNKGQSLVHMVNVFNLVRRGELAYNVIFLIEGNEETGSPNIRKLLTKYKSLLKADFILISDSSLLKNHPTLEVSLRGVFNTTLVLKTSDKDLHSGLFGGPVPNSAHEAAVLLAKLYDNNKIVIDDFYADVAKPDKQTEALSKKVALTDKDFRRLTGSREMLLEKGETFYSQAGVRPTVQVTGIESGYTGKGYRNSIPSSTTIKFNFRLVNDQKPDKILKLFKLWVKKTLPGYVDHEFLIPDKTEGTVIPVRIDINNPYVKKSKEILQQVYKKEVYYDFNGATLPIIIDFKEVLKTDLVMVALANEDCNMHAVNENFDLQSLKKALEFSNKFLSSKL